MSKIWRRWKGKLNCYEYCDEQEIALGAAQPRVEDGWEEFELISRPAAAASMIQMDAEGQHISAKAILDPPQLNAAMQKAEENYSRLIRPAAAAPQGMTIAGDGAAMLGKLMREQRASRLGVYPDGNPNASATEATAPAVGVTEVLSKTDIARIFRPIYGANRYDATAYEFARGIETAVLAAIAGAAQGAEPFGYVRQSDVPNFFKGTAVIAKERGEYWNVPVYLGSQPPAAQGAEPVVVEAVATVDRDGSLDWLIEGGPGALEPGEVLMICAERLTDDTGSGEVYRAASPQPPTGTEKKE